MDFVFLNKAFDKSDDQLYIQERRRILCLLQQEGWMDAQRPPGALSSWPAVCQEQTGGLGSVGREPRAAEAPLQPAGRRGEGNALRFQPSSMTHANLPGLTEAKADKRARWAHGGGEQCRGACERHTGHVFSSLETSMLCLPFWRMRMRLLRRLKRLCCLLFGLCHCTRAIPGLFV